MNNRIEIYTDTLFDIKKYKNGHIEIKTNTLIKLIEFSLFQFLFYSTDSKFIVNLRNNDYINFLHLFSECDDRIWKKFVNIQFTLVIKELYKKNLLLDFLWYIERIYFYRLYLKKNNISKKYNYIYLQIWKKFRLNVYIYLKNNYLYKEIILKISKPTVNFYKHNKQKNSINLLGEISKNSIFHNNFNLNHLSVTPFLFKNHQGTLVLAKLKSHSN